MSVSTTRFVSAIGLYTPFRGFDREVSAVGTLSLDAALTGDGTGGTITLSLSMERVEFGFHPILLVTRMSSLDGLATAEQVTVEYSSQGNERLNTDIIETNLPVAGPGSSNIATYSRLGVPIEPNLAAGGDILIARWTTNTDTIVYHLHVFGVVYDAEAMARGYRPGRRADELLAGIR